MVQASENYVLNRIFSRSAQSLGVDLSFVLIGVKALSLFVFTDQDFVVRHIHVRWYFEIVRSRLIFVNAASQIKCGAVTSA
jgi:hypothetical protein